MSHTRWVRCGFMPTRMISRSVMAATLLGLGVPAMAEPIYLDCELTSGKFATTYGSGAKVKFRIDPDKERWLQFDHGDEWNVICSPSGFKFVHRSCGFSTDKFEWHEFDDFSPKPSRFVDVIIDRVTGGVSQKVTWEGPTEAWEGSCNKSGPPPKVETKF